MSTLQRAKKGQWQPFGDRILLKPVLPEVQEKKTVSGIILPAETKGKKRGENIAEVIRVSDQVKGLVPGDTVVYSTFNADRLTIDSVEHVLVPSENIVAVKK